MKKVIIFCTLLLAVIGVRAQTGTMNEVRLSPSTGVFSYEYPGGAGTTSDTVKTQYQQVIYPNAIQQCYYNGAIKVTNVTNTGATVVCDSIVLEGRRYSKESWTILTAVKYFGVGTDTTVNFTQVTTGQTYRAFRIRVARKVQVQRIAWMFMVFRYL